MNWRQELKIVYFGDLNYELDKGTIAMSYSIIDVITLYVLD